MEEKNMKNKKTNKKVIAGLLALVLVAAAMVIGYKYLKPETQTGAKAVQITVVSEDGSEKPYQVQTDAEYLKGVMDEAEGLTYSGTEGDYGLMIDTVNGETASYEENGAYWAFSVNDEYCNYGIAEQPAADGDEFKIVYAIGE